MGEEKDEFFEKYGIRVLKALRRIIRAVDIHSRKLNNEFHITAPQLICLYSLAQHGNMTLSDLAKEVNLGTSTVNGIVDRLEEKQYLTRTRSSNDRRKVILSITESGHKITRQAPMLLQDRLSASLRSLPELEQATITLSLERIVELMEAEHLDASPNLLPNSKITK